MSVLFLGRDSNFLDAPLVEGVSNPMCAWVHAHWVTSLAPDDADGLLVTLGKRAGLAITPAMCALARTWTGCYPSLLRHFGSALVVVAENCGERAHGDMIDPDRVVERYLDLNQVQGILAKTFSLLRGRYVAAFALLCDLLACRGHEARLEILVRHGGWLGKPAKALRRFGLLVGRSQAPELLHCIQWYARDVLDLDMPHDGNDATSDLAGELIHETQSL